jgi:hypothetical protein
VRSLASSPSSSAAAPATTLRRTDTSPHRARSLAAGPTHATGGERDGVRQVGQRYLDEIIEMILEGHRGDIDLDGVRSARVVRSLKLTDFSKTMVTSGRDLRSSDGQTLYVIRQRRWPKDP